MFRIIVVLIIATSAFSAGKYDQREKMELACVNAQIEINGIAYRCAPLRIEPAQQKKPQRRNASPWPAQGVRLIAV
jgi:hypothetical protein